MPHCDQQSDRTVTRSKPDPAWKACSPQVSHPDDSLFIYYLQGRVQPDQFRDHSGFLGTWQEDDLSFLFFARSARDAVLRMSAKEPGISFIEEFQTTYGDWQGGAVTGFTVGCLTFCPPWEEPAGPQASTVLRLDPGVVFGTGLHATTLDCLRALQELSGARPPSTVLDLGTGSGVLALAAAALGTGRVLAVDLNPLAVRTAAANIALNRLEQRVLPVRARADQALQLPADLVLANIHFDVLQDLVTKPAFAAKERFILSGLLSRQGETIRDRLHSAGATIERSWLSPDGWATIVGRNDSSRHQEGGPHGHGPD